MVWWQIETGADEMIKKKPQKMATLESNRPISNHRLRVRWR